MSLQNTRSSHTGFTIPGEEDEEDESNGHIDNPMVEKRRFELFIDLIWVGIVGNLVRMDGQILTQFIRQCLSLCEAGLLYGFVAIEIPNPFFARRCRAKLLGTTGRTFRRPILRH